MTKIARAAEVMQHQKAMQGVFAYSPPYALNEVARVQQDRIAEEVLIGGGGLTRLQACLAFLLDEANQLRSTDSFLHTMTTWPSWPYGPQPISKLTIGAMAKGLTERPSPATVRGLLFCLSLLRIRHHPAFDTVIGKALIRDWMPLRDFVATMTPNLGHDDQLKRLIRQGRALTQFLITAGTPQPDDFASLPTSPLLADIAAARSDADLSQAVLSFVRLSSTPGKYVVGQSFVTRIEVYDDDALTPPTPSAKPLEIFYAFRTETLDVNRRPMLRSMGFAVPRGKGDLYLFQHHIDGSGFNTTFFPHNELSRYSQGFARCLLLTFDKFKDSGAIASRMAVFRTKAPSGLHIESTAEEIRCYLEARTDEGAADPASLFAHLHNEHGISLVVPRAKRDSIVSTWGGLLARTDGLHDMADRIEIEPLVSFSRSPLRAV
ncbi:MAG: hypothetical protein JWQ16_246 [Novosphingobium sp.]|nr:hypothetical protein [Novosphingobium sp.]